MRSRGAVRSKLSRLRRDEKKRALTETERGWARDAEIWLERTRKRRGRPRKNFKTTRAPPPADPEPPAAPAAGPRVATKTAGFGAEVAPVVPPPPKSADERRAGPAPKTEIPGWHDEVARQAHAWLVRANAELAGEGMPTCPSAMLAAFPESMSRTLARRFPNVRASQEDVDAAVVATCVGTTGAMVGISKWRKRRAAKAAAAAAPEPPELDDDAQPAAPDPEPPDDPSRPPESADERPRNHDSELANELASDLGAPAEPAANGARAGREFALYGPAAEA